MVFAPKGMFLLCVWWPGWVTGARRWPGVGNLFPKCEGILWIDATEDGWRLDFKENHMRKDLRVAWGWGMVGVGVKEGARLAWVGGSTWLNTGIVAACIVQAQRPRCPPTPQPEQP